MKLLPKSHKILTIKKVRLSGKWMEFWFHEPIDSIDSDDGYQLSCKIGDIHDIMDEEDTHEFYNTGLIGRQLRWKYKKPNWTLIKFEHPDNYQSWIGKYIRKRSNKPFKSTYKEVQVIGLVYNNQSNNIAFQLDDSIVDCKQCVLAEN